MSNPNKIYKNFNKNFSWGCATSSYQVEGATNIGGRSESIWDVFARTPGKVYAGENGDVAADQYHRYQEDIGLMKELGLDYYRFSIAWPRIIPNGIGGAGKVNAKGIAYYNRLVDTLLSQGIKAAPTLFHWDLPQVLQDKGGWNNRDTAYYFADYAEAVYQALNDRVDFWITLNEPWCAAFLGHLTGEHAPGIKNRKMAYQATHHLNLAHGLSVEAFHQSGKKKKGAQIGVTHNLAAPIPASDDPKDILAADRAADRDSRMFLNPLKGEHYPERHLKAWNIKIEMKAEDAKIMAAPIDFIGINYYKEDIAKHDPKSPEGFKLLDRKNVPISEMGWPSTPQGIRRLLNFTHCEIKKLNLDFYVTENGYAAPDQVTGSNVHDPDRIVYLDGHLDACSDAINDGVPLKGYFVWSFIDNYEWAFGYQKRFGIVYCDFYNLKRIPKDSYYFYQKVIANSKK